MKDVEDLLFKFQQRIPPDDIYETCLFFMCKLQDVIDNYASDSPDDYVQLLTQDEELQCAHETLDDFSDILDDLIVED